MDHLYPFVQKRTFWESPDSTETALRDLIQTGTFTKSIFGLWTSWKVLSMQRFQASILSITETPQFQRALLLLSNKHHKDNKTRRQKLNSKNYHLHTWFIILCAREQISKWVQGGSGTNPALWTHPERLWRLAAPWEMRAARPGHGWVDGPAFTIEIRWALGGRRESWKKNT